MSDSFAEHWAVVDRDPSAIFVGHEADAGVAASVTDAAGGLVDALHPPRPDAASGAGPAPGDASGADAVVGGTVVLQHGFDPERSTTATSSPSAREIAAVC